MFVKSVTMRTPQSGNIYKKSEAITVTKNFCETLTKISLIFKTDILWHGKVKKTRQKLKVTEAERQRVGKVKRNEERRGWYKIEQIFKSHGHQFKFWLLPCCCYYL